MKLGLQLYSVRGCMEKDFEGTIKKVAEMGYECVEFAGYYGRSAEEIKAILKKYNLECASVHQGAGFFLEQGQKAVDYLKAFGVKYSVIPHMNLQVLLNDWDSVKKDFDYVAKLLRENGMQLMYHNHDFEIRNQKNGMRLLDFILSEFPDDLLIPQFDVCWVKYGGAEPVEYINKFSGKVPVLHMKDFVSDGFSDTPVYNLIDVNGKTSNEVKSGDGFRYMPVGQGVQNVKSILDAAEKAGTEYIIVEQDDWYESDPLKLAEESCKYLRKAMGK